MRRLPDDVLVRASTPAAFAAAVDVALHAQPDALAVARRRQTASLHSWDARAQRLARLLDDARAGDRRQPAGSAAARACLPLR